jgi:hypothetical protein
MHHSEPGRDINMDVDVDKNMDVDKDMDMTIKTWTMVQR